MDHSAVYTILDELSTQPHSTPTGKEKMSAAKDHQSAFDSFLDDMGMDPPKPKPVNVSKNVTISTQTEPRSTSDRRQVAMKPRKFDGTGSLESFLTQFDVCARHNQWSDADRVDFLKCSLDRDAVQLLWDFGAEEQVTYSQLVERLRQRYGTEGQAETYRAQLYFRRQRPNENLGDLMHDIRRLVVHAYPVPSNATTEILAKDSFLEAIRDRELSLKVREKEPKSLDEAYRIALRLNAYQNMSEADDRRRNPNRVRANQEAELSGTLEKRLDTFFAEQRKWQRDLEERLLRQADGTQRSFEPPRSEVKEATRSPIICYNCGMSGHIARRC